MPITRRMTRESTRASTRSTSATPVFHKDQRHYVGEVFHRPPIPDAIPDAIPDDNSDPIPDDNSSKSRASSRATTRSTSTTPVITKNGPPLTDGVFHGVDGVLHGPDPKPGDNPPETRASSRSSSRSTSVMSVINRLAPRFQNGFGGPLNPDLHLVDGPVETRASSRASSRTTTRSTSAPAIKKPKPLCVGAVTQAPDPNAGDNPTESTADRPLITPGLPNNSNLAYGSPERRNKYIDYVNMPIAEVVTTTIQSLREDTPEPGYEHEFDKAPMGEYGFGHPEYMLPSLPRSPQEPSMPRQTQTVVDEFEYVDDIASSSVGSVRYSRAGRSQFFLEAARPVKRPTPIFEDTLVGGGPNAFEQRPDHSTSSSSSTTTTTPRAASVNHHGTSRWNPALILYILLSLGILAASWIGRATVMRSGDVSSGDMLHHAPEDGDSPQQNLYERFQRALTVLERSNERVTQVMERLDKAMNAAEYVSQDAINAQKEAVNARQALADATAELENAKASWEKSIMLDKKKLSEKENLHDSSIQHLQEILPDKLVVTKSPDGGIKIGDSFWVALKAKIEEDYGGTGPSGARDPGNTKVDGRQGKQSQWQDFLAHNERLVEKKVNETFKKKYKTEWAKAIEEEVILARTEFLDILNRRYMEMSSEVDGLREYFGDQIRQLDFSISNRVNEAIMERYNHIAREDVMKSIQPSQLESMAHVAILANAWSALTKINWLSPALEAVVDPNGTSASYDPNPPRASRRRFWWFTKHASEIARYPRVNAPLVALLPWNELDDCWCTPMNDESSLDVHLGRLIYPSEITIEFVPASSTPDIDAAPRKIQVWGRIEENKRAWTHMKNLFRHLIAHPRNVRDVLKGWSPLAEFQYDIRHVNHVQTFAFPFDAEAIKAAIGRIRLKLIDNWGNKSRVCLYRVRLHGKDASSKQKASEGLEETR